MKTVVLLVKPEVLRACRSLTRCLDLCRGEDAVGDGQIGEIFQAGESVRTGLDGVPRLVQEFADVADASVDRLRPDAEQGSDGGLGQGKALMQDGGQEPVGQGEDGPAADAGGDQSRAVRGVCPGWFPAAGHAASSVW